MVRFSDTKTYCQKTAGCFFLKVFCLFLEVVKIQMEEQACAKCKFCIICPFLFSYDEHPEKGNGGGSAWVDFRSCRDLNGGSKTCKV